MKHFVEALMKIVFFIAATISVLCVLLICVFLFKEGIPAIEEIGFFKFIFGMKWVPGNDIYGIFPMIIGSIYVTAGAMIIGVPIGILTAIFMARYCPPKAYKVLKFVINLLAGIPSVVYGFFGLVVMVPYIRTHFGGTGFSVLTASILLGIMILPTIIGVSEASIKAVPENYYEGAIALGATPERAMFKVILPASISGITAAITLGIGRAIGETMAVIMIAGNNSVIPGSILDGVRTMTSNIVLEMGYASGLHKEALIATGVVLFVFILVINLSVTALKEGSKHGK